MFLSVGKVHALELTTLTRTQTGYRWISAVVVGKNHRDHLLQFVYTSHHQVIVTCSIVFAFAAGHQRYNSWSHPQVYAHWMKLSVRGTWVTVVRAKDQYWCERTRGKGKRKRKQRDKYDAISKIIFVRNKYLYYLSWKYGLGNFERK